MTPDKALLKRVEAYLKANDMSATRFGRRVMDNPNVVKRLRNGNVTATTMNKIIAWLDRHEATA